METEIFEVAKLLGGAGMLVKTSALIALLVSSMKCTNLNRLVWARLGPLRPLMAPLLGLLGGVVGLGAGDVPITLHRVAVYVAAGGGAVFLHEVSDALKGVPGVGPVYLKAIAVVEKALGGAPPAIAPEAPGVKVERVK